MDCASFKENAALFALGSLDAATRLECEAHLREGTHDGCIEALDSALLAVDSLAPARPKSAGEHVWARVAAGLGPRRPSTLPAWAVATCLAGLLAWALIDRAALRHQLDASEARGAVITTAVAERDDCLRRERRAQDDDALRAEAVELLRLPGTALFALPPEKGQSGNANVIIHTGVKRAYVAVEGLRPAPDRDYEMWIAHGKKVVSVGVLRVGEDGKSVVRIDYAALLGDNASPDAMMITLEPRGGAKQTPGPTVLIGATRAG